jgi:DNA (cytosine-5)-methyltransferase 1
VLRARVPEATVDKDGDLGSREHDVDATAGQVGDRHLHLEAKSTAMEFSTQAKLGGGVPAPLAGHTRGHADVLGLKGRHALEARFGGGAWRKVPRLAGHRWSFQFISVRRVSSGAEAGAPAPRCQGLHVAFRVMVAARSTPQVVALDENETSPAAPAMTVLDLFAGAGGLSAGLNSGGSFTTVRAVEMDVAAAATYAQNHGKDKVYVGPIQDWLLDSTVPEVDVIIGGPPCQGFSTLGKQDVEDDRNTLWLEYARTITKANPRYFVVENVAAFMKSPQFAQFQAAIEPGGLLEDYTFRAEVLNAADYGAYQARKRAVLIGHRRDVPAPRWPAATHRGRHLTVRQALKGIDHTWDYVELPERRTTFNGFNLPGAFRTTELHLGRDYSSVSRQRFRHIPEGGNRFDLPDELLAPCWRKHTSGSADVMGRLHWDAPSVTIRTEFFKPEKGRYLHPVADRAITHLEAALLQGFPRDYLWVGSKTAIARQIGNAVPLPLGRAIGQVLASAAGQALVPTAAGATT